MLEVQCEGIYASDVGENKKTTDFNFKFEVAGNHTDFLESHLKKRYIPMMIRKAKNKPMFSKLTAFRLIEYKANDKPCGLDGVDIMEMSEWQIQELARYYNLLEIPLPFTVGIAEMREKAAIQYLKIVKGFKMDKDEEKEQSDFFMKTPSGSWVFNTHGEPVTVDAKEENLDVSEKPAKITLSDVLNRPNQTIKLPSADDLTVNL